MDSRHFPIDYSSITQMGYDCVKERMYTISHPEVLAWTKFFEERFRRLGIFERFEALHGQTSIEKAIVVGVQWHRFSEFMPWFLCRAASMVSNNRLRHYVIQTGYEELGMRDVEEIHHEMFWRAAQDAGVTEEDRDRLSNKDSITKPIEFLRENLLSSHSDEKILGMLLGIEMPARENIETIFSALAHTPEHQGHLDNTKFFKLHRQLEMEHIRLNISIFLRFCRGERAKERFLMGFDSGMQFWSAFWSAVGLLIDEEKERARKIA